MGWEYSDTDCKFKNVCNFSCRCTVKGKEDDEQHCNKYEKDERTFLQKLFYSSRYNERILEEFNRK